MTDPLSPSETDRADFTPYETQDGGLNATDWADKSTARNIKILATVIMPMIFFGIVLFAVFMLLNGSWKLPGVNKAATLAQTSGQGSATTGTVDKDAEISQLQGEVASLQNQLARPAVTAQGATLGTTPAGAPVYNADPGAIARLSARLDRVEANQKAIAQAAVSANAATVLQQAAHGQAPFLTELAAVQTSLNAPSLTTPLQPLAEKGVPTAINLAIAFPGVAARADIAAKDADDDHSLLSRLKHMLSFISIRRVDGNDCQNTDSVLNCAETRLSQGDLKAAVAYLDTLPAPSRRAIAPWLAQAHARVLVDDTTAKITATALNHLSQTNFDTSQELTGQPSGGAL